MALTKVSYSMITGAPVNALDFGVDPSGTNDSAAALQQALNACVSGQYVEISGSIKLNSQVVVPATCGGIIGQGMGLTTITYTKEQSAPPVYDGSQCAIVANGVDNVIFQDFSLVYTGTYYVAGDPYFGVVSGLYINNCDNAIVRRIEATGFNCTGVQLTNITPTLSLRGVVEECYLHHNRQSGCYFNCQKFATIRNCKLEYNGDFRNGGVGYGFSANTDGHNEDLLVTENHTYNNYRKGIDFHDGFNIVCTDNVCIKDQLHGIFYENTNTIVGDVLIANNYIECDPTFTFAAPYDYYKGISVYLADNAAAMLPNVTIVGNILKNIYKTGLTNIFPIYVQNQTGDRTLINISKNTVRGGSAAFGVLIESATNADELTANIEGNLISLGDLSSYGIGVTPYDPLLAGTAGYCQIINNNVIANSCGGPLFSVKTGMKTVDISDNSAFLTTLGNESIKVENTINSIVRIKNNSISATADGTTNKIVYGGQLVTISEKNTVGGAEQPDVSKIASTKGNRTYKSSKTLVASTLTDLLRIVQQYTASYYKVKWSAFHSTTSVSVAVAGGEFTFVAVWDNYGQIAASTLSAGSAQAANNGETDIALTWTLATDLAGSFVKKLQVTSNVACTIYFEIECVSSLDATSVAPLILL